MTAAAPTLVGGGAPVPTSVLGTRPPSVTGVGYDVDVLRRDFPLLGRQVNGAPLVYLDNAATSQKPVQVLEVLDRYWREHNANVHRGIHTVAQEADALYDAAREQVAAFLGGRRDEVVFTKNATEGYNLVAQCLLAASLPGAAPEAQRFAVGPGDEIVITEMEHHSNIVPWQLLCQRTGATLRWLGLTDDGRLDLSALDEVVTERTRLVAFVHQSNILGTVNPVAPIVARAREVGALVLLDACQSVPHMGVDVAALDVDFLVFTGHKALAPTGIGVLWGRYDLLAAMPPFLGGGDMIELVRMEGSTFAPPPSRFEAGTPPIAEAIGLGAALEYLTALGMDAVADHEHAITGYALEQLATVPDLRIIGPADTVDRGGAISFALGDVHPHDVGQVLDSVGVAVRVGHHCARPVCSRFGLAATTRASFHCYTTTAEVDALVAGLHRVREVFC